MMEHPLILLQNRLKRSPTLRDVLTWPEWTAVINANDPCSCTGQCGQHEHCNKVTPREYEPFCYWCGWRIEKLAERHGLQLVPPTGPFSDLPLFRGLNQ